MRGEQRAGTGEEKCLGESRKTRRARAAIARRGIAGGQDHPFSVEPQPGNLRRGEQSIVRRTCLAGRSEDQAGLGRAVDLACHQPVRGKRKDARLTEVGGADRRLRRGGTDMHRTGGCPERATHIGQFGGGAGQARHALEFGDIGQLGSTCGRFDRASECVSRRRSAAACCAASAAAHLRRTVEQRIAETDEAARLYRTPRLRQHPPLQIERLQRWHPDQRMIVGQPAGGAQRGRVAVRAGRLLRHQHAQRQAGQRSAGDDEDMTLAFKDAAQRLDQMGVECPGGAARKGIAAPAFFLPLRGFGHADIDRCAKIEQETAHTPVDLAAGNLGAKPCAVVGVQRHDMRAVIGRHDHHHCLIGTEHRLGGLLTKSFGTDQREIIGEADAQIGIDGSQIALDSLLLVASLLAQRIGGCTGLCQRGR